MKPICRLSAATGPALLLGLSCGAFVPASSAQPAPGAAAPAGQTDIGTATVSGSGTGSYVAAPGSAPAVAPASTPLNVTEPTSVIGPNYIQHNVVPTAPYDEIIKFTPSVQNISPTGNGLQQNFNETIRGFQYTQFNTTLDGIVLPGAPTNFAPQTGAYILPHDLESVTVDRGPGTASTIGYATFGGSVALQSRTPSDTVTINPYGGVGSFESRLYGLEADTGVLPSLGGAKASIDVQREEGQGYLTSTSTERRNLEAKLVAPVGSSSVLTLFTNVDNARTHTPYGATLQQIQTFGPNFALNENPRSQNFTGYDVDVYTTDFEYLRLQSDLGGGWTLDNTLYTNAYNKRGTRGTDVGGTTALNGRIYLTGVPYTASGDVPGYPNRTNFRDYGNIVRLSRETSLGPIRAGLWVDYIPLSSSRYSADLSLAANGQVPYTTAQFGNPFQFSYRSSLTTIQPYIEWALRPLPGLEITPGLRFTENERLLNATLNAGTKLPQNLNQHYNAFQPSIEARYSLSPNLSVYGQIARGFLAPPINVLQTTRVTNNLSPQTTVNYQVGAAYKSDRFALAGDLYYIDFNNRIATQSVAGINVYTNGGGAIYKGVEVEGTAKLRQNLFLYANGSLNDADYTARHVALADSPRSTGAIGPLFQNEDTFGSVLAKYIGPQWGLDVNNNVLQDQFFLKGYATVDLAAGHSFAILNRRRIDARVNVSNLFDNHSLINVTSTNAQGLALYYTDPGRSIFFTVSATL